MTESETLSLSNELRLMMVNGIMTSSDVKEEIVKRILMECKLYLKALRASK